MNPVAEGLASLDLAGSRAKKSLLRFVQIFLFKTFLNKNEIQKLEFIYLF